MKDINFANGLTKKEIEVARWMKTSTIIVAITILILTIITIRQLLKINLIKQEVKEHIHKNKELNQVLEKKRKLIKEKIKLTQQYKKIQGLQETPKKKIGLLTDIYKALPKQTKIESITLKKTKLAISMVGANDLAAATFIQKISAFPQVREIKIASIRKKQNQLVFTLTGILEKT